MIDEENVEAEEGFMQMQRRQVLTAFMTLSPKVVTRPVIAAHAGRASTRVARLLAHTLEWACCIRYQSSPISIAISSTVELLRVYKVDLEMLSQ